MYSVIKYLVLDLTVDKNEVHSYDINKLDV